MKHLVYFALPLVISGCAATRHIPPTRLPGPEMTGEVAATAASVGLVWPVAVGGLLAILAGIASWFLARVLRALDLCSWGLCWLRPMRGLSEYWIIWLYPLHGCLDVQGSWAWPTSAECCGKGMPSNSVCELEATILLIVWQRRI